MSSRDEDRMMVTTVDEDGYFDNEEDFMAEDKGSVGSERSGSDYIRHQEDLPDYVWFGEKECRCIFTLEKDKGAFQRVCGNEKTCNRPGHGVGNKAGQGYYQPVKARKYTDGMLATLLSKEEFQLLEKDRRSKNSAAFVAAGTYLGAEVEKETPLDLVDKKDEVAGKHSLALVGSGGQGHVEDAVSHATKGDARAGGVLMRTNVDGRDLRSPSRVPAVSLKDDASYTWIGEGGVETEENPKKRSREAEPSLADLFREFNSAISNLALQVVKLSNEHKTNTLLLRHMIKETKLLNMSKATHEEESQVCYAVAYGRGGIQGIFDSQGEVAPLVVGVPNNQHKRCDNREEAKAYIEEFNLAKGLENAAAMKKRWYVVTNTATGSCNIFRTFAEASTYTTGVKCATCMKFNTLQEAKEYATKFRAKQSPSCKVSHGEEDKGDDTEIAEGEHEEVSKVARLRGGGKDRMDIDEAEPSVVARSWKEFPPALLLGHDMSTGNGEAMFGFSLNEGEAELRSKVTPGVIGEGYRKGMVSNTIDAVSMPGMYSRGEDGTQDTSEELTILGEAMEELVNQKRQGGENFGRSDLHWRSDKRVTLGNIRSLEDLRTRVLTLGKLMPKIRERMVTMVSNACKTGGMRDNVCSHSWSNHGWLTVIVTQSFLYYLGLHQHLLAGGEAHGWAFIKPEIDHYVQELRLLRSTADSRIHCICLSYALLRDGYQHKWFNVSIQQARNAMMFGSSMSVGSSVASLSSASRSPTGLCPKCGTNFHGSDPETCPWKNQSDEKAKKNAANALKALGRNL